MTNQTKENPDFKQLKNDENLYKQMFEFSLIPILIHDMEMNILDANQMAIQEFGYTKEELLNIKVFDLHTEIELEHSAEVLEKMQHENELSVQTSFKRKDSSEFFAEATPHRYIFNNKPLIHVYIQNITQRKENELMLIKARQKAEEADRLKSEFLANMSHELRTPLNAILGFASFLKDKKRSKENTEKYADIIINSGEHLLSIINDIIDISIIEAGKLRISKKNFELNSLLISLYNFFHSYIVSIKKFKVALKLDIPEHDVYIISDEKRIRQILTNLIGNAIKYTEKGEVQFGYKFDGKNLIFFVKDTGNGIAEDKKEIIFERFRKAADTKEKIYGGTGLGLSIAKACVDILEGRIWLKTEENFGSTFFFSINYEPGKEIIESPILGGETEYNFSKEMVLVAEDDDYNFAYLEKLLLENNLLVQRTVTGRETIKYALEQKNISLILMDIKMPDLSGIEATIEIKKHKPKIPIIAQTAFAFKHDKEEILAAGCVEYISKPINSKDLLQLIEKHLIRK